MSKSNKSGKILFLIIALSSLAAAIVLFFVIKSKMEDNKKKDQTQNQEENLYTKLKKIADMPVPDINIIYLYSYEKGNDHLCSIRSCYHDLNRKLNEKKNNNNTETPDSTNVNGNVYKMIENDRKKEIEKLEIESILMKSYMQFIYELSKEDIFDEICLKFDSLMKNVILKINKFDNSKQMIDKTTDVISEFLFVLATFAFKYKEFVDLLFNKISFGRYSNFSEMMNNFKNFNNLNKENLVKLTNLDKDKLYDIIRRIHSFKEENDDNNFINILFNHSKAVLFKSESISTEFNYFFNNWNSYELNFTKKLCQNILEKIYPEDTEKIEEKKYFEVLEKDEEIILKENTLPKEFAKPISDNISNMLNYLKYKFFISKVVVYCIGKIKIEMSLDENEKFNILKDFECDNMNPKLINSLIASNEGAFFVNIINNLVIFMKECSKLREFDLFKVEECVKKFLESFKHGHQDLIDLLNIFYESLNEKKKVLKQENTTKQ